MSAVRNIRMLTRYNKWASTMLLDAIASLPPEEVIKKRAAAFGGLSFALAHVAIEDQIWRAHLLGEAHGFTSRTTNSPGPFELLSDKWNEMGDWYIQYADTMTEAQLNEITRFTFVDGGTGEMTRGDMFYQSGFRPPSIDLPVYFRGAFNEAELS